MISNRCPSHIEPALWHQMSADARYQAQETARAASGLMDFVRLLLIAPPLLFILLPPVQRLVNEIAPPSHYVKLKRQSRPEEVSKRSTARRRSASRRLRSDIRDGQSPSPDRQSTMQRSQRR